MRLKNLYAAFAFALLALPPALRAGVPGTLNYQGRLRTSGGALVPDSTSNSVTFRIFSQASGGTALWAETWSPSSTSGVTTSSGLFNVVMGSFNPVNLPFDQPYWLEVVCDNAGTPEAMIPRQPLTAAPYAFRAMNVDAPLSLTLSTTGGAPLFVNNTSAGGFVAAVLAQSTGTNHAVEGKNLNTGALGTLGGQPNNSNVGVYGEDYSSTFTKGVWGQSSGYGVYGTGLTGVAGVVTATGQVALSGDTGGQVGALALHTVGNSIFQGGSVTFSAHVDFSSATVTGLTINPAVPMSLTGAVPISGAGLSVTNTGTGYGIVGASTAPGYNSGTLDNTQKITAGVYGYTGASLSAGVMGMNYNSTSNQVAGVIGLGYYTGILGNAYGATNTAVGGSFDGGPNGLGVSAQGVTGVSASGSSGGAGIVANQNSGNFALMTSGNSLFSGSVGSIAQFMQDVSFNAGTNVYFTGANVIGLPGLGAPLNLTSSVTGSPALYAINTASGSAMVVSSTVSGGGTLVVRNGGVGAQSYGVLSVAGGSGTTRVGVLGSSDTLFTNASMPTGVYGYTQQLNGAGVMGLADGAFNASSAVYGYNSGASNNGAGVRGENNNNIGYGVTAYNSASIGSAIALSATSASPAGIAGYFQGVSGVVISANLGGVSATAINGSGIGVYGYGGQEGLHGRGTTGVYADGSVSGGIYGVNALGGNYGVKASGAIYGVYASSATGTGVYGQSSNNMGMVADGSTIGISATASAATGIAVYGEDNSTNAAIKGINHGAGIAVYGIGTGSGVGVQGSVNAATAGSIAVYGANNVAGTYGVEADNTAATASSGAALFVNGLMKVQTTAFSDTGSSGTYTGTTVNQPAGRITFSSAKSSVSTYTVANTMVSANSVVLVSFVSTAVPTNAGAMVVVSAGSFTVHFNPAISFSANDIMNFVVINQ